jgi:hypothetical protein
VASRALAVSAASGAGVTDPTTVRVIANARGEGAVRAATALYEGSARARQLRTEAAMGRLRARKPMLSGLEASKRPTASRAPAQCARGPEPLFEIRHERAEGRRALIELWRWPGRSARRSRTQAYG